MDACDPAFDREHNGLVYTCRGGFIDTAHVRDYADWAIYLAAQIARRARARAAFELPDEAGARRVIVRPLPPRSIDRYGLRTSSRTLGAVARVPALDLARDRHLVRLRLRCRASPSGRRPSRPRISTRTCSAAKLMLAAIYAQRQSAPSPRSTAPSTAGSTGSLELLGARAARARAARSRRALDGLWWDSSRRVPDPRPRASGATSHREPDRALARAGFRALRRSCAPRLDGGLRGRPRAGRPREPELGAAATHSRDYVHARDRGRRSAREARALRDARALADAGRLPGGRRGDPRAGPRRVRAARGPARLRMRATLAAAAVCAARSPAARRRSTRSSPTAATARPPPVSRPARGHLRAGPRRSAHAAGEELRHRRLLAPGSTTAGPSPAAWITTSATGAAAARRAQREADRRSRRCVREREPGWLARLMWLGVRLGGHPIFPTHYRWGYGRA